MGADYRPMGALDEYERDGIDEGDYDHIGMDARAAADAALDARDGRERQSRMPAALLTSDDDGEDRPRRRRRGQAPAGGDPDADPDEPGAEAELDEMLEESGINLEDYSGPLAQWIQNTAVAEEVKRRFRRFLHTFDAGSSGEGGDQGASKYAQRVRQMCAANRESLEVSYLHLSRAVPILAIWVADCPRQMLKLLDEAAMDTVRLMFPDYHQIHEAIHVRITHLPISDSIRDLRQLHMDCLVKVSGVVTRRSSVFPQLKVCKFNCLTCGYVLGPFSVTNEETKMAGVPCPSCQSKGPYQLNTEQTVYCNYQKLTLQESPGSVPPGRLPRHKEVILLFDLIDIARPGEEIEVIGVYHTNFDANLNIQSGFPVFSTQIEANHVQKTQELLSSRMLTEDDRNEIRSLAKDPQIQQKIIQSIAPSIFGHEDIKTSIALCMFGGVQKDVNGKHRIRGDINVLLLGDPGTAKSQFLKYVEKTAPRAVYTTGQGASAVGLTASVHKDTITREWTLEGGALVLADRGVCIIDEFDKMNDGDRTSIHEAMEQQSISISKAGIITSLQARCSVVAAANPIKGRYDGAVSFAENVDLTEPILSRFDCICVVKDQVNAIEDERLAEFVVSSHRNNHPHAEASAALPVTAKTAIDQTLLKRYIMYARNNCRPSLTDIDQHKITKVYSELRRESANGGVAIAVRHIESIIRMSEASARMHLRDYVRESDVDLAISVTLKSVIKSQKYAVARTMENKFRKYLVYKKDVHELLLFALRRLFHSASTLHSLRGDASQRSVVICVEVEDFEAKTREFQVADLTPFYASDSFTGGGNDQQGFRKVRNAAGVDLIIRASAAAEFTAQEASAAAGASDGAEAAEEAAETEQDEAAAAEATHYEPTGGPSTDDEEQTEAVAAETEVAAAETEVAAAPPAEESGASEGEV